MPSPEHDATVAYLRSVTGPNETLEAIVERRAQFEELAARFVPPSDVELTDLDADGIPLIRAVPAGTAPSRSILYFHGGAYCLGSARTHRDLGARLAKAASAAVLVVDYRLAPEHPFPAAVDDAVGAYRWLVRSGHDPGRVVLAGDSAGGGLAVAALVALRDAGEPLPAAAVCLSPWFDLERTGASMVTNAEADVLIDGDGLAQLAAHYLAGGDPRAPLASPIHASLVGLPPLLIHVGTTEMLLDDAVRLAERARREGVDVTLELLDELAHVFHFFPSAPEAAEALDRIGAFVAARTT